MSPGASVDSSWGIASTSGSSSSTTTTAFASLGLSISANELAHMSFEEILALNKGEEEEEWVDDEDADLPIRYYRIAVEIARDFGVPAHLDDPMLWLSETPPRVPSAPIPPTHPSDYIPRLKNTQANMLCLRTWPCQCRMV